MHMHFGHPPYVETYFKYVGCVVYTSRENRQTRSPIRLTLGVYHLNFSRYTREAVGCIYRGALSVCYRHIYVVHTRTKMYHDVVYHPPLRIVLPANGKGVQKTLTAVPSWRVFAIRLRLASNINPAYIDCRNRGAKLQQHRVFVCKGGGIPRHTSTVPSIG